MGFWGIFGKKEPPSGQVARDRLQMVIFNDRLKISPQVLDMLKSDIIKVISNYLEIDESGLNIELDTKGRGGDPVLLADIPIKSVKRR